MRPLDWTAPFGRAFKRAVRRQPELRDRIERVLRQLAEDPFHPTLHSHKLKGALSGAWACTVDYDNRILFEVAEDPTSHEEVIRLLTLGTHDEVY
ncbi:MAG: type II toxin-antitoxin system mRNA interferase toxin, RelE/StbE family [Planctomycetes bacterium]|nr:type II toxin-antitoxin system mRNA interferase toxin, RelE/StbE family [Planctomycetota bacterium]MBM4081416.1 type II toxin-antitoxin system mRNA interferase toxin, RelE/StbE family [Planctomycetota bacterium]MBM4085200.1 type II toxin-antitoxin system mRNA interferase toxin, RelE/StbE family [Planctomycetota bacterium]